MQKKEVFLVVLIGALPLLWYVPGQLIAKGDYFPYIFGAQNLNNDFYLWSPSNLGNTSPAPAYSFYGLMLALLNILVANIGVSQIILYLVQFAGAALSMLYLVRTIYPKQDYAQIIAVIFYIFNVYMLSLLLNIGMMWAYSFLPLLIALLVRVLTQAQNSYKFIFCFAVAFTIIMSVSGVNLANLGLTIISLGSVLFYYTILERKIIMKLVIRNTMILLALTILLSTWWVVPVLNHYLLSPSTQLQPEVSVVVWSWTHARASFLNLFWLNAVWGWRPEYFPHYTMYSNNPALSFLVFVPFLLASTALLLKGEKRRFNTYFMLVILVFTFLAKGLHEPFGSVNLFLYNHIPYMNMFREPISKFTMIMIPFLALLIGYSTDKIAKIQKRKSWSKLVITAVILILAVSAFPVLTNPIENKTELIQYSTYVSIPQYWYDVNEWFNNREGDYRILVTPLDDYYQVPYSWGYYGSDSFIERLIQKPIISPCFIYSYKINPNIVVLMNQLRDAINYNRTDEFETMIRLMHVKYILQRNDLDYRYMETSARDMPNPKRMRSFLSKQADIKLVVTIGKLDIYEYTEAESYMRILKSKQLQEYDLEFKNETVFRIQWDFSSTESLNQWKNAMLLNQFGALCKLYLEEESLRFELWNSTWGWKVIVSPSITAEYGKKYNIRFDIKGENAHEVHVKIHEYDKNTTLTHSEYVSYVTDGTFNWQKIKMNYRPKIENTSFLQISIWNGHQTNKALPNIIWIDNFEAEGYITNLNVTAIQQALLSSEKNPSAKIVRYEKINPTKMTVEVNASQPFILEVNEGYDPYWKAYVDGEIYDSVAIFSVMNGFRINKTGHMDIVIEYEPQKWFLYGSLTSATTFLTFLAYATYKWVRSRKREERARSNNEKIAR